MKCPFRKMTETVDDTTREYYMDCYGEECPFYDKHINSFDGKEVEGCVRVDTAVWESTHYNSHA